MGRGTTGIRSNRPPNTGIRNALDTYYGDANYNFLDGADFNVDVTSQDYKDLYDPLFQNHNDNFWDHIASAKYKAELKEIFDYLGKTYGHSTQTLMIGTDNDWFKHAKDAGAYMHWYMDKGKLKNFMVFRKDYIYDLDTDSAKAREMLKTQAFGGILVDVPTEKAHLKTLVHEWGHTKWLENTSSFNAHSEKMAKKVLKLYSAFKKERLKLTDDALNSGMSPKELDKILPLSHYAMKNANEFWAEGVTKYILNPEGTKNDKYAQGIGKILDEFFKR